MSNHEKALRSTGQMLSKNSGANLHGLNYLWLGCVPDQKLTRSKISWSELEWGAVPVLPAPPSYQLYVSIVVFLVKGMRDGLWAVIEAQLRRSALTLLVYVTYRTHSTHICEAPLVSCILYYPDPPFRISFPMAYRKCMFYNKLVWSLMYD